MLTIDMILALSEDELRACDPDMLINSIIRAENRLADASDDLEAAALNLDPLESTGTAVDEVYDFETTGR